MSSKPGYDLLSSPSITSSKLSMSSSALISPIPSKSRRSSKSGSDTESVFQAKFLRITAIVCATVVLLTVGSVFLYIGRVHRELSLLREELVQMETCIRRFTHTTGGKGDGVLDAQEGALTSRDDLLLDSWNEEVEASVIRAPGRDPAADYDGKEAVEMPSRRSKRETGITEGSSPDPTNRRRSDGRQKATRQPKRKTKKEGNSLAHAIHFQAGNASTRTFMTKSNSPVLDFWQPVKWSHMVNNSFYHLRDGTVTIKEEGLYFIYAQIVFHDLSGRWSFSININDRQELKCINSEHIQSASNLHPTNHGIYQHCFSSSLFYIRHLEQVTIRSLYEQRNILLSPEFTFWGIIKMS